MRILLTNTGPWGTGSFTVAKALLEEYLEMGHQAKLFFPDSQEPSSELDAYYSQPEIYEIWKLPIQKKGLRLDSFPLMITDPHPRNPIGKTFKDLTQEELYFYFDSFRERITPLLEEFKPDIIECQHIWAYDHIISELGYPFITAAHHSDQLGFRFDPRMRPIAMRSAQDAQLIFALSEANKNEIIELYGVSEEKIITFDNGYDRKVFHPFPINRKELFIENHLSIPEESYIVSFAGKLSKTKGFDLILQANQYLNETIHFLILGTGNVQDALQGVDLSSISEERVHYLGHRAPEEVAYFHNAADITIMPSRSEGFGISCLEAMGCGLPAIVTESGGPETFAIGEVIKKEYTTLSEKAIDRAHEYSWTSIAKKRLKYYHQLLS